MRIKVFIHRKIVVTYEKFYHHYHKKCRFLEENIVKNTLDFIVFVNISYILSNKGNKSTNCSV